ncbi:hypothetical protein [Kitasatospora sp. NBC_01302]|uniref:hypothetical protein n=1 Tax=Kitasatospora sp. NBC_01302 TaxID=2903575 RepID=UPI002E137AAF|nr:hypothetical protein OG294_34215 [Kitasatospora sp. NBC_01302]
MDDDSRTVADTMTPYSADASGGGTSTTPYLTETPRNLTTEVPLSPVDATPRDLTIGRPLSPVDATPHDLTIGRPLSPVDATPRDLTIGRPLSPDDATPRDLTIGRPLSPDDATPTSVTPFLTDATPRNLTTETPLSAVDATPRNLTTETPLSAVDATPRNLTTETPLSAVDATPRNLTIGVPLSAVDATPRLASTTPYSSTATSGPTGGTSGGTSGGAAGSGFAVDPSRYRAAVSPLLAAVEQLTELSTGMTAFLSTMEGQAPWGNDESGKKFAEGDKGYLKYSADTMKTLNGMPDGLKYVADGLKAMADGYEGADGSVQGDLNNADTPAQQSAPLQPMETTVSPILPREPMYRGAPAQDRTPVNGKG